jgi:hypothetical protein
LPEMLIHARFAVKSGRLFFPIHTESR